MRHKNALLQEIERMSANTWLELSGTNLSQLPEPATGSTVASPRDSGLTSYSSGVWDPIRRRYMMFGGGHGDYDGNEVYKFDLNEYSPTFGVWTMETTPHEWTTTTNAAEEIGTPTQPVSAHTYGHLTTHKHHMVVIGGGGLFSTAHGTGIIWLYDMDAKTWTKQTATSPGADSQNAVSFTDNSGQCWYIKPGTAQTLHHYDPEADVITAYDAQWTTSDNSAAAFRETSTVREIWTLTSGTMRKWDLFDPDTNPSTVTQTSAPYTGSHNSHGFVYVAANDRFIGHAGGTDINTLNPNGTWTAQSPTGATPESENVNYGTYKRFWYHDALDRCFAFQTTTANVFCYRPPASY